MSNPVNCTAEELSLFLKNVKDGFLCEPCTSSRAVAGGYLPTCSSDTDPCAPSRSMTIASASYRSGKQTVTFHGFRFSMTLRRSTEPRSVGLSSVFAAGFHARTLALPEGAKGSPESGAAFGFTWPGSSAKYDPATRSWKTRQCSLLGDLEPYSGTFPRWGICVGGELWELPTPVIATAGTGSGSSGNWPTPIAQDAKQSGHAPSGTGMAEKLSFAVVQGGNWPTPTCADQYTDKLKSSQQKEGSMHSVNLSQAVGMNWATPQTVDHKKPRPLRFKKDRETRDPSLPGNYRGDLADQIAGVLNPEWEEPLMSWPVGWTQLEPLPVLNWPFRDCGAFVAKRGLAQHEWEPPRTCGKIPNRNARVKAIGNGQDPSALVLAIRLLTTMKLPFTKAA